MWRRRRTSGESELEAILRRQRADAPDGLVHDLASRIVASRPTPRRAFSRVAFAAAVSVFILGTFASFGGLGYAASNAKSTLTAVKKVVVKQKLNVSVRSSAADQYAPTPAKKPPAAAPAKAGVKPAAAVAGAAKSGGTLPFTGVSLLATFVLSLALIAAGLVLRRRERRN